MKVILLAILAMAIAHSHSHGDGHSHDAHGHSHEEAHAHRHNAHGHEEARGHSHDAHGHSHDAHGHSHDAHGHSHDAHGHSHDAHGHSHDAHGHRHEEVLSDGTHGHSAHGHNSEKAHSHEEAHGHSHEEAHGHSHEEAHGHSHEEAHGHSHEEAHGHSHEEEAHGHSHEEAHAHSHDAGSCGHSHDHSGETALETFVKVFKGNMYESAPWLILGLLLMGGIKIWATDALLLLIGGDGFGALFMACIVGLAFPMCTCGVLAMASQLHKLGVSASAFTVFLLSACGTGLDSLSLTYGLQGNELVVVRGSAVVIVAMVTGTLVHVLLDSRMKVTGDEKDECCGDEHDHAHAEGTSTAVRLFDAIIEIFDDIYPLFFLGLVLAAAMEAFVEPNSLIKLAGGSNDGSIPYFWKDASGGYGDLFVRVAVVSFGMVLYTCEHAAVAIAVGLVKVGASQGTAIAFLTSAPMVNATLVGLLGQLLGGRGAALVLSSILTVNLVGSVLVDVLVERGVIVGIQLEENEHAGDFSASVMDASVVVVAVLFAVSSLKFVGGLMTSKGKEKTH